MVSTVTMLIVVLFSALGRGFMKIIPILIGVIVGYLCALVLGLVNFSEVSQASILVTPHIQFAKVNINVILTILPTAFVVIAEHIGHLAVTSNIVGRDLSEDPGLHRSLLGDVLCLANISLVQSENIIIKKEPKLCIQTEGVLIFILFTNMKMVQISILVQE